MPMATTKPRITKLPLGELQPCDIQRKISPKPSPLALPHPSQNFNP